MAPPGPVKVLLDPSCLCADRDKHFLTAARGFDIRLITDTLSLTDIPSEHIILSTIPHARGRWQINCFLPTNGKIKDTGNFNGSINLWIAFWFEWLCFYGAGSRLETVWLCQPLPGQKYIFFFVSRSCLISSSSHKLIRIEANYAQPYETGSSKVD